MLNLILDINQLCDFQSMNSSYGAECSALRLTLTHLNETNS